MKLKYILEDLSWWKVAILLLLLVLLILLFFAYPLLIIWAINTLVPTLAIQYSFWTYIAVCILNFATFGGLSMAIRSKN
jgi:hypothetical protein